MRITAHRLFVVGMAVKALDGTLELAAGALLSLESRWTLLSWLRRATAPELSEDPGDFVATHLRRWGPALLRHAQGLVAGYLILQGLVKLALVIAVLRGVRRAFPWAIGVIGGFALFLGCQAAARRSAGVGAAAVLDLLVAALLVVEYRARRAAAARSAEGPSRYNRDGGVP